VNRTGRIPFVWSALAALALLAAAATPGVPADEARFAAEASRTSVALGGGLDLGAEPGTPLRASLSGGAAAVSGASHAAGARAGLPHRVGFRLPSVAAGALVATLVAALAGSLAGPGAALLAPALLLTVPRALGAFATAGAAPAVALAWLAAVLLLLRAAASAPRRGLGWAAPALLFVAGVATSALPLGPPGVAPLVAATLGVPAAILALHAGGLLHALVRLAGARGDRAGAAREATLLAGAVVPIAAAALGLGGDRGGALSLAALPVLSVLGARALVAAARAAWPAGAGRLTAAAAVLVVWPAARATIHHHGRALGWSELAGGLPGAATRALPRGGGEAVALALPALAEHARPGARVWFGALPEAAVALYRADGRLRGDLASATSPADADLAVVALDGSRDPEYRVWTAFRTARPVHAVVLDEVPLAFVYARPGAWR
jgi:hypothetical protein